MSKRSLWGSSKGLVGLADAVILAAMRARTRALVGALCLLAIAAVGLPAAAEAAGLRYFGCAHADPP
jgi:hypothetical protein